MNPQQSTRLNEIKYKILFLGEMSTGKTSIIERFTKNVFQDRIQQTVGIDLTNRNIAYKHNNYKLQLWDTAGQQKFRSLVPNYIRDAHCAVFVYDITDQKTLYSLAHWYELYKNYQSEGSIAILVGNKNDKKQHRQISIQSGLQMAKKYDMAFAQVSAKTGQGIEDIFYSIVQNIDIQHSVKAERQKMFSTQAQLVKKRSDTELNPRINRLQGSNELSRSSGLNKKAILCLKQKRRQFACCYI